MGSRKRSDELSSNVKAKKLKVEGFSPPVNDFNLYLTKVSGIDDKWNRPSTAVGIEDILSLDADSFESSVQFNYMIDIPWLMSKYPEVNISKPLLIVTGGVDQEIRAEAHQFKNVSLASARLEIAYGTHHTKMMILKYRHGLRVAIHTANLICEDWHQKTQGVWLSPLFPKCSAAGSASEEVASSQTTTNFRSDLVDYLKSYKLKQLDALTNELESYDFSAAKVFLVGSTPGRHVGPNIQKWGHPRMKHLLKTYCNNADMDKTWPLVGQFSSIGSLGSTPDAWLTSEFRSSLCAGGKTVVGQATPFHLVYPCVENVRTSLEGYPAGGSLPYSIETARKQPYLKRFLHQWKSDVVGRSRASPHVKCYSRCNASLTNLAWFLITSANLSKAAWGALEKNGSQLVIRSYELGVLFLPQFFDLSEFCVTSDTDKTRFPLPFDLPLTPYGSNDEPWIVNLPYKNKPDTNGNMWCPS